MKTHIIPIILGIVVLAVGCTTAEYKPLGLTGNLLTDGPLEIAKGPPKDKVLWEYRTAAAAMSVGNYPMAKQYLDDALLTLGGIYGKDKDAQKARSYFHEESVKTFIGEPYERVMAYYYRGILYWMDGQPDNARACFRSGEIEDSSSEEKFSGDYALLDYLDGFAATKISNDGSDAFKRAVKLNDKLPPYDQQANVLVFMEFGPGPEKYATGRYDEELHFRAPPSPVVSVSITADGQTVQIPAFDDLGFQATTRGGRLMDHKLGNKAVFKTTTDVVGDVAIVGGAATVLATGGRNETADIVGGALILAGIGSKIFSAMTTPEADIRAWDNLPRYLSFAALRLSPGVHAVKVDFLNEAGQYLPNLTKNLTVDVPPGKTSKVIFVSDKSH